MKMKRFAKISLALVIVFSLASCSNNSQIENGEKQPSLSMPAPPSNETSSDTEISLSEDIQDEISESSEIQNITEEKENPDEINVKYRSKLTGLPLESEELSNQRPVAIMFNNLKAALPQHGICKMDVLYEAIVEGSITRLLGIAENWQELPTLGSIRSSRDYYIDFSDAHNAIYVHAGGSQIAYNTLAQRKTDNIDGTNGPRVSSNAFYRNQERRNKGVSIEHTLFTSGERLTEAIKGNKFNTVLKDGFVSPFRFSDSGVEFDGKVANYVYIPFSTYAQSYFDYNTEKGVYDKGQYVSSKSSLDKHDSPHTDGNDNSTLSFKNIIIIYTSYRTIDDKGRQAVQFTGNGTGYYFTDGKCKEIMWNRPTRTGGYTLYEADGTTELLMNPGKTYVAIVKNGTTITYK